MPEDLVRNYLNTALHVYFDSVLVRRTDLGKKHGILEVSPSRWRALPSWRYRLDDSLGGYELVLWNQRRTALSPTDVRGASKNRLRVEFDEVLFLIKYYPHPDESLFENFSVEEQMLRLGEVFKYGESVFPLEKKRDMLSAHHFTVGTLMLAAGVFHSVLRMSITSQDRFLSIAERGVRVMDRLLVKPGDFDRSVPGWEISWKLCSKIVRVYREHLGLPYMVVELLEPGKIWRCYEHGCEDEESAEYLMRILEIIFLPVREEYLVEMIEKNIEKTAQELKARAVRYNDRVIPRLRILWKENRALEEASTSYNFDELLR